MRSVTNRIVQRFICALAAAVILPAAAFDSTKWMAERDDDSDALRLRKAYAEYSARVVSPAENVAYPLELRPDGTVKTRIKAAKAHLFADVGFVWAEGVRVESFNADGSLDMTLEADNCIADRAKKTLWVDGRAVVTRGDTVVSGRGVYVAFETERVKIFSETEIKTQGLKMNPGRLLK